ncbi:MAG: DUF4932 domain-containing protein [Anaerolineae bacterium]|nr:DUF4932 domain-containing protein [Anaerolineae bacterium]
MNASDIVVRLDDRVRLMSALLAATNWPDKSQEKQPHGTHLHARATRKYLHEFRDHPAVQSMQNLLKQGAPLEAMFTFALCLNWPELRLELDRMPAWVPTGWIQDIRDFYTSSQLDEWWETENTPWQKSLDETQKVFENVSFKPFLAPFLGPVDENLVFIPSISYPSDQEIGLRIGKDLICIAPPRLAWGDSPPWPFDEDPAHVYRAALSQYGRMLLLSYMRSNARKLAEATKIPIPVSDQFSIMYPSWEEQFATLFVAAAVAIYLEDHVSAAEAKAYVLMARKAQGMTILPGTVSVLRRYLSEREAGRYQSLMDFLPIFPKQLRVAKRIVSL